jgi:hypothetical protein
VPAHTLVVDHNERVRPRRGAALRAFESALAARTDTELSRPYRGLQPFRPEDVLVALPREIDRPAGRSPRRNPLDEWLERRNRAASSAAEPEDAAPGTGSDDDRAG